ncbi:MAG TPA: MqnA/MqnD/SBP family protein [Planctomycetota bacterium]|jgi:1,4-dihydroxy-6-naphthoate synthase|nr:MqnA/MqnD/SBP family protein [Planctomycetota bacterium]
MARSPATPTRTFSLGHSPDPDDAFMHFGLASGRVETPGMAFEQVITDIETLNRRAEAGDLDETAISFHAYAFVRDRYLLLPHGGAMGEGYGPVVVSRRRLAPADLTDARVAIPGERTTAALALRLLVGPCPTLLVPFDRIPAAVLSGEADAGVLIHEGQLTYAGQGLHKVLDLGHLWKEETGLPLPLGGNAVRRDLGEWIPRIRDAFRRSIAFGLAHRDEALTYALRFARGLSRDQADRFVGLYVNDSTLDFGESGRRAIATLYRRAAEAGLLPAFEPEFAD